MSESHHNHPPGLQHQFDDMEQQQDSAIIGMWVFLAQEIMFFGGIFTAYLVFRYQYPMAFAEGSNHLDAFWGFINTLVLIVSSLTMALTVYFAQKGNRNGQVAMILLTMLFGAAFLGVKAVEYTDKYNSGLIPVKGLNKVAKEPKKDETASVFTLPFETRAQAATEEDGKKKAYVNPDGSFQWNYGNKLVIEAEEKGYLTESERIGYYSLGKFDADKFRGKVQIFYWLYFAMTGLHALHMVAGLILMTWLLLKAWANTHSAE